jgi:hypothetical protein
MKRIRIGRPSPALAIAVLALFLAMGGTVYAAAGKISGKTIKPGSIPANRLKKHSVTGHQIDMKKLGTVPSANSAVTAASATHAASADSATNAGHAAVAASVEQIHPWFTTASEGQTVTLMTIGPFTYTGECASGPEAITYVETSQVHSAADSYEGDSQTPFEPGERLQIGEITSGVEAWNGPNDGSDAQLSGDGHTYVNTNVSVGTGVGGAPCTFAGFAFAEAR